MNELKELCNSGAQVLPGKSKVEKQTRAFVLLKFLYTDTHMGSITLSCGREITGDIMLVDLL